MSITNILNDIHAKLNYVIELLEEIYAPGEVHEEEEGSEADSIDQSMQDCYITEPRSGDEPHAVAAGGTRRTHTSEQ